MKLRYWTPDGPPVKQFRDKISNEIDWGGTEPFGFDDEELMRFFKLCVKEKSPECAFSLLPLEVDE